MNGLRISAVRYKIEISSMILYLILVIFSKILPASKGANFVNSRTISFGNLKDKPTMDKTEAQIVSYGILYLNPSSRQCQPSYKKYIAV